MAPNPASSLECENRELRARLAEAEEVLRALAAGEVDAFVAPGPEGDQVFTLKGADHAYRVMVQGMAEGAVTVARSGLILFANEQFARLVQRPLERVIGAKFQEFVLDSDSALNSQILGVTGHWQTEAHLRSAEGPAVPVFFSAENLLLNSEDRVCLIVTDLREQKRNDEIVASERLARLILEQCAEGILVIDPGGRITRASSAAEKLAGKRILGSHFDQAFDLSFQSGRLASFAELLSITERDEGLKHLELTALRPDDQKLELLVSSACLRDTDAGLLGCVVNLTDITDRKRKESQLIFQAGIIGTTAEAVIAIDPDQRVTFWNSAAERLYGVPRSEALGRPLSDCYHNKWIEADDEAKAHAALARNSVWQGENLHVRCDGTSLFVTSTVNVIEPEYGGGTLAVVRDVTESKRAYGLLQESEARERARAAEYQAIMDVVPAGVFVARDPDCLEIIGNQMASELLRSRRGENLSKSAPYEQRPEHFQVVKDGKEVPPNELPIQRAARTGQPVFDFECELIFQDGTTRWWLENAVPLFDESGVTRGAVGAFVDITERKLTELEVQKHVAELARANEDLLHFAYAASHDLQTPLRNVTSFAQILALRYKSALDETGIKIIDTIVESSARMSTMLNDLLQFAKVAGSEPRTDEAVYLEDTLTIVLKNLKSAIQESGATITYDPLPTLACDPGQFVQLFQNLIGNSLKYRQPTTPPIIHISAQELDDQWVIAVRDNGIGFDPKYRDRIFGVFQRLHSTDFAGTGIGLTICKRIVERRGGRMWADGIPEKGATFSFSIPTEISPSRFDSPRPPIGFPPEEPEAAVDTEHLGELFQTLDLTPALVRKLDGAISVWTQGSERLFGWSKSEALGRNVHELLRTEFLVPVQEIEAELLRSGEWHGNLRKVRHDGGALWVASHWALYRDGAGRPHSVIEVNTDITALKNAEEALRLSSRQRDLALEAGRMGVWRWDLVANLVKWDQELEKFHGMPAGSFEGTFDAFLQRVHPEDRAMVEARVAEAIRQGSDYATEYRGLRLDGTAFWMCGQGKILWNAGEVEAMVGVAWDVTARKQNERELAESFTLAAARLQEIEAVYRNAPIGLVHLDKDLRFVRINDHLANINGLPASEHIGRTLNEVLPSLHWISELLRKVIATREPLVNVEFRGNIPGRTSEAFWRVSYFPLQDSEGNVVGVNGVVQDVTERKLKEAAWLETAERLGVAAEAAHLGIFTLDVQKDLTVWENKRIYEMLGRDYKSQPPGAEEFIRGFVHPDDADALRKDFQTALQSGEPLRVSYRVRRENDGMERWIETFGAVEKDANGAPLKIVGAIADITERKQAELALRASADRFSIATTAAQLGVFHLDILEDQMHWENPRMYEIFGRDPAAGPLSREEFLTSVIHPGDAERMRQATADALSGNASLNQICRIWHGDGALRWIEFSAQPEFDRDGTPLRLTGVTADITDRVEAERALREQQQYTRSILDSLQTLVGVLNPEGILLDVNQAALGAAGIQRSEVIGKHLVETFWWSHSPEVQEKIRESVNQAGSGVSSRFDVPARTEDGKLMTVDYVISPFCDQNTEIGYLIWSANLPERADTGRSS